MIGKRPTNYSLFDVGNVWPLKMNPKSFHYQFAVATQSDLFKDDDFAALYHASNGRPSVPPSQLALMLILHTYDGVSDEQAIESGERHTVVAALNTRPVGRHASEWL